MALSEPPPRLRVDVTVGGASVRLKGWSISVNEWEVVLEERRLLGSRRVAIALPELLGLAVSASSRAADHHALLLKTRDETFVVAAGARLDHLLWVAEAIQEAELTRSRREGVAGREYLFDRVVPDDVKGLLRR